MAEQVDGSPGQAPHLLLHWALAAGRSDSLVAAAEGAGGVGAGGWGGGAPALEAVGRQTGALGGG